MVRPSRSDNNPLDCSGARLAPLDTAPRQLSDSGSKHRLEVPARQVADPEKWSTRNRRDSGHSAVLVSNPPPLYRQAGPAPSEDGTWGQRCNQPTGARQARVELNREPALGLGRTHSSASCARLFLEGVSLNITWQCCLNNLNCLSGNNGVGRINDDLIIRLDARCDFYRVPEIMSGDHGSEHNSSVLHYADP